MGQIRSKVTEKGYTKKLWVKKMHGWWCTLQYKCGPGALAAYSRGHLLSIFPFMLAINSAATGTIHTYKARGSDRSSCCFKWHYSISKTANSAATTSVTWIHHIHQKIDFPILNVLFSSENIKTKWIHRAGRKQIGSMRKLRKEKVWKTDKEKQRWRGEGEKVIT